MVIASSGSSGSSRIIAAAAACMHTTAPHRTRQAAAAEQQHRSGGGSGRRSSPYFRAQAKHITYCAFSVCHHLPLHPSAQYPPKGFSGKSMAEIQCKFTQMRGTTLRPYMKVIPPSINPAPTNPTRPYLPMPSKCSIFPLSLASKFQMPRCPPKTSPPPPPPP